MSMKEKEVLLSTIKENLASIVGASGHPEELVRLTTAIVQGTKRLLEGVPDALSTSSTTALTSFVICAKSVAKNPRGVDATVIKQLSTTRKDVEKNVNELEKWHFRSRSPLPEDLTQVMEAIAKPQSESRVSPEACSDGEREKKLMWDLQRRRDALLMKMDPQQAPEHGANPQEVMVTAVQGLMRGADDLTKHSDNRMPSKDALLEPMILVVDMVCKLLDLVDSLFVSKYPMRSQVYSFCTALIDNIMAYGQRSKSDDVLSLRNISTQTPALLNASKVMVEQCEIRLSSLQSNMDKSLLRVKEMKTMGNTDENRKSPSYTKNVPTPSAVTPTPKPETKPEFEVHCMVCTSVAVDQKTQQPISRGTELTIMVLMGATVKDIKQDLASRTGLLYDSIQLNQGQDELTDRAIANPNNPSPYFLFNRDEPTEDELLEQRKADRQKNKLTLETLDWSTITGPIAVAVFEYDTLGDEKSLAFDEGDIIEIMEKSADGWWEGRSGQKVGTFPASFVKEISSTEEGIRAIEKAKGGSSTTVEDEFEETSPAGSVSRHSSDVNITSNHSPKPSNKKKKNIMSRGTSNPEFNVGDFAKVREFKEKGLGILKGKKKKSSGYVNLSIPDETPEQRTESPNEISPTKPAPVKPLFKPKRSNSNSNTSGVPRQPRVLGDDIVDKELESADTASVPTRNTTQAVQGSPKPQEKVTDRAKKRPPPPKPQPFAKTHPNQAAKLNVLLQSQCSEEEKNEDTSFTAEAKKSNSMEDLLKNLEDFEIAEAEGDRSGSVSSNQLSSIEYETYKRPTTPPQETKEVETIKISEYKSDSEESVDDDDDDEGLTEQNEDDQMISVTLGQMVSVKVRNGQQEMSSLKTTTNDWKPHEWTPSPEPVRKGRKPPSWSCDVNNPLPPQPRERGSSFSKQNGMMKAASFDQGASTKPSLMAKPKRSSGSPKKPGNSPRVTPSPSPRDTPSPNMSLKSTNPGIIPDQKPLQKPVAPPRNKKKGSQSPSVVTKGTSLTDNAGRRGPSRAPPPPPAYKSSVIPTSQSDIGLSNSPGLQRR